MDQVRSNPEARRVGWGERVAVQRDPGPVADAGEDVAESVGVDAAGETEDVGAPCLIQIPLASPRPV